MLTIPAQTITGKVIRTDRAGTSHMGNPSYDDTIRVETIDGTPVQGEQDVTVRTQSDSGLAYGITNLEYRELTHEFSLTKAGRIRTARKVA